MKLSKLFCSDKNFRDIQFNLNGINVIYADVQSDMVEKKNSHNLGKTKLSEIIDFMLLKRIDKHHFLNKTNPKTKKKYFAQHTFYLEIQLINEKFLIIKRSIEKNTKISFRLDNQTTQEFTPPERWDVQDLSIDNARKKLSSYLDFDFFKDKDYDYRKALNYCLRTPPIDYNDVYKLANFAKGKDVYWKPFVFSLLGFDGALLQKKYESDNQIQEIKGFIATLIQDRDLNNENRDDLVAAKQENAYSLNALQSEIEKFNFFNADKELIIRQVEDIDSEINNLNTKYYSLQLELERIEKSLQTKFIFDINKVKRLYEEARIYFSHSLVNDYDELIAFNNSITENRIKHLKEIKIVKKNMVENILLKLEVLNSKRENFLQFLTDSNSFEKFKIHQRESFQLQEDLNEIEFKIKLIDKVSEYKDKIKDLESKIQTTKDEISRLHRSTEENELYKIIRTNFSKYYKEIMNETARISWELNNESNINFNQPKITSGLKDKHDTSKDEGTTYKKILCIVFDLAILTAYHDQKYFRFLYHDDALSQQDDGIKNRLLGLVKNLCVEYDLQYIISVIKADLPHDDNDEIIHFDDSEIVLTLSDKNETGTLFGFEF